MKRIEESIKQSSHKFINIKKRSKKCRIKSATNAGGGNE